MLYVLIAVLALIGLGVRLLYDRLVRHIPREQRLREPYSRRVFRLLAGAYVVALGLAYVVLQLTTFR